MDPRFQFVLSAALGVIIFLYLVGWSYWRSWGWALGRRDPLWGHDSVEALLSSTHRTGLLAVVLLAGWAILGTSPHRRNWEIELLGMASGVAAGYLWLVLTAASRSRAENK